MSKKQTETEQSTNENVELNERLRAISEELAALTEIDAENRGCIMLFVDKAQGDDGQHRNINLISGNLQNLRQCYVNLLKDECYVNLLEDERIRLIAMKHVLGI